MTKREHRMALKAASASRKATSEREVAFCETCATVSPWLTAEALGERCYRCGSERISRGQTGARYRITEDK